MKPVPAVTPAAAPVKVDQHADSQRPLLPHERDEKPDMQPTAPTKIMKQAYQDLQRGLVDTDLHGQRGVENVLKKSKDSDMKK